jgi:hypothetical protein
MKRHIGKEGGRRYKRGEPYSQRTSVESSEGTNSEIGMHMHSAALGQTIVAKFMGASG